MRVFGFEPAVIAYAVNAAIALLVAYGLDLSQAQVEAVAVITTALLAAVAAAMTRPIVVSVITGAAATVLVAVAAFGVDLNTEQIGATVTALSIVLSLLLRQAVSPVQVVGAKADPRV